MDMLGYPRGGRNEDVAWWGVFNGNNTTALGVGRPFDKQDATTGNGVMVALIACSAEHIQELHALAINHGGTPGMRPHYGEGFYSAYVRDPDGSKLAFVYYTAQS
ncbi:TPA: VOC family protein [Yersinia enterocolitica]|uniref:VOC family protein n=1 Tax=Yersinia enterocolitica TaxID=630 RepID=UPI003878B7E7